MKRIHWMALANIKLLSSNLDAVRLVNVIYVRLKTLAARAITVSTINLPRLILEFFTLQLFSIFSTFRYDDFQLNY